ncbi:MAG: RsmB/NOP family class I SAM-dependent RNA methyltransferase [Acutalibacteraceae bacterium]
MDDFLNEMKKLLGDEYEDYLKFYNDDKNYRGLRVNKLKCTAEKLSELLPFELKPTPFCKEGFYIPQDVQSLGNNPLHHCGAFYIQEPSATSAVTMLNVEPDDYVLDLCASPGGKSTQIASELLGTGLLFSNEIVKNRASVLLSNIERCGVRNAVVTSCHPDTLCNRLTGFFDKILVDAPCSGEGMFRKHSSARDCWSKEHVFSCAQRQLQILNSAKNALKSGGVMVYSTCTFSKEENEGVIEAFLKDNSDFELEDSGVSFGRKTMGGAVRIFPMDGGEGHFAARLRKKGENIRYKQTFGSKNITTEKIPKEVIDFYKNTFVNSPFGDNIKMFDSKAVCLPDNLPDLTGLSVFRAGVLLGEVKKNRFEPAHCAFIAAKKSECKSSVDFDFTDDRILKFLHGEEISVDENLSGYTAVCVNGITVGFGKAVSGTLKNKYPKGLRTLK